MGPVFDMFDVGEFRAPARPTFVNSDKSRQKHRKKPPVSSLPGALCFVLAMVNFTTRSRGIFFFDSSLNRLCSSVAAADAADEQRCWFYR